tara:strand:+ start:465 stop:809 length:345 start_codon:yes stop_codon:yes gene_type:complete
MEFMFFNKRFFLILIVFLFVNCDDNSNGWIKETQLKKRIENINFNFPESTNSIKRDSLIEETFTHINEIKDLTNLSLKDTIYVRFVSSRDDTINKFKVYRNNLSTYQNLLFSTK